MINHDQDIKIGERREGDTGCGAKEKQERNREETLIPSIKNERCGVSSYPANTSIKGFTKKEILQMFIQQ